MQILKKNSGGEATPTPRPPKLPLPINRWFNTSHKPYIFPLLPHERPVNSKARSLFISDSVVSHRTSSTVAQWYRWRGDRASGDLFQGRWRCWRCGSIDYWSAGLVSLLVSAGADPGPRPVRAGVSLGHGGRCSCRTSHARHASLTLWGRVNYSPLYPCPAR